MLLTVHAFPHTLCRNRGGPRVIHQVDPDSKRLVFFPSTQPVRNLFRCPFCHPILTLSSWCSRHRVNRAVIFLSCSRIWLIFLLPVEQQVRLGHGAVLCCFHFLLSCTNISLEMVMCKNPNRVTPNCTFVNPYVMFLLLLLSQRLWV